MSEEEQYLTVEQASDILQVSPRTVRRYITEGELPGAKIGNRWRIDRQDLREFVDQRKTGGDSPREEG